MILATSLSTHTPLTHPLNQYPTSYTLSFHYLYFFTPHVHLHTFFTLYPSHRTLPSYIIISINLNAYVLPQPTHPTHSMLPPSYTHSQYFTLTHCIETLTPYTPFIPLSQHLAFIAQPTVHQSPISLLPIPPLTPYPCAPFPHPSSTPYPPIPLYFPFLIFTPCTLNFTLSLSTFHLETLNTTPHLYLNPSSPSPPVTPPPHLKRMRRSALAYSQYKVILGGHFLVSHKGYNSTTFAIYCQLL